MSNTQFVYQNTQFDGSNQQTLHLNYVLRHKKATKKTGCIPLLCRITISNTDREISAGPKINPEYWDKKTDALKENCPQYVQITAQLATFKTLLQSCFTILTSQHQAVTAGMLKAEYKLRTDPNTASEVPTTTAHTILKSVDELIKEFEKKTNKPIDSTEKRSKETLKQWNSTRTKLIEYLNYRHTGEKPFISRKQQRNKEQQKTYIQDGKQYDIALSEIKPVFAEEFITYLTEDRTIKIGEAAANKQLKNTKQVFTYAIGKGWLQINPLGYYRTTDVVKDVIPLEWNEVQAIMNLKNLTPRLDRIRDAFIVQIFTGFAFQDLKALTIENIIRDPMTGVYFLCRERGKTGIDEMVPILPIVKQIIDKYIFDPECRREGVLFPIPSNTHFNEYLKELQERARINKKLHTHLARHTFAHLMLNHYGLSLEIVSRMLGHKSIRTTQRYCKISLKRIAEAFAPEIIIERPKLTIIRKIETSYRQHLKTAA